MVQFKQIYVITRNYVEMRVQEHSEKQRLRLHPLNERAQYPARETDLREGLFLHLFIFIRLYIVFLTVSQGILHSINQCNQ